jgi:hypothetical protein
MPPQKMTAKDFAAWVKKQDPSLAAYPDEALVAGILARRPDLKAMIIQEPPKEKGMPLAPDAWGRMKQAYEGNLPLLDENMATLQGAMNVVRGTKEAVTGIPDFIKSLVTTAGRAWNDPKADMGDVFLPKQEDMEQIRPALRDINQSPDPTGTYLKAAGETASQGAGQAITAIGLEGAGRGYKKLTETYSPEEAARRLTDVINPPAKQIPTFQAELARHLDKIMEFAKRRGLKLNSIDNLAKAIQGGGLELKNYWYDKVLGPVGKTKVLTSGIPGYTGAGEGAEATLEQLDRRLSDINNELAPKYGKEGLAAQQAVKTEAELNAEAAGIRKVLYPKISELTGIPLDQVASTRQAMGSMRKLGDQAQLSASTMRRKINTAKSSPRTFNPFDRGGRKFIADEVLRQDPIKAAGKTIEETLGRTNVPKYQSPAVKPTSKPSSVRPAPVTGESKPIGSVATPSAEDIAGHQQNLQDRISKVIASRGQIVRKPIWEMGEDELEQLRRGGGRPGTVSPLEQMKMAQDKVNSIRLQVARNPGDYNAVSQLQKAEGELETLQNSMMSKAAPGGPKTVSREGGGGSNYTAEQLAEFKKKWGIE